MPDCSRDDIRDLLPELLHDQLDAEERACVEDHLAECVDCAAELGLLQSFRASAFPAPALDIERVAAAVRESMTQGASGSDGEVIPIADARRERARIAANAGTARSARRAGRRGATSWIATHWRVAAAIAVMAAGSGGYLLSRGGSAPRSSAESAETIAAAGAPQSSADAAAPKREAKSIARAADTSAELALAAPSTLADVEGDANDLAESTMMAGYNLSELSESDMEALLQSVDDLDALPELEPHQLPLLASVMEGAL